MIYLAYDGSLHGDWVFRYALHLAANTASRTLTLVHVRDGLVPQEHLDKRLAALDAECSEHAVRLVFQLLPQQKQIVPVLLEAIPGGAESFVVCGTRSRSRHKSFIAGTISEQLLRLSRFNVLAVRVVQPGLLGNPRDFLLPLGGHPRGFRSAWPFFRLFLPDAQKVFLLRIGQVNALRLRHLSSETARALRQKGSDFLQAIADEIRREAGEHLLVDSRTVLCDDWVREVLLHASHLKVRMTLLGATERTLPHRLTHRNALERVLRGSPCDVGVYRGL